jgi:hypothetical protein
MKLHLIGGITALAVISGISIGSAPTDRIPTGYAPPNGHARVSIYGDLNRDGVVNLADATLSLQIAVGLVEPTAEQWYSDDVYPYPGADGRTIGDVSIDIKDTQRILRFAVGLMEEKDFRPLLGDEVSFHNEVAPILQNTCESFLCHGGRPPKGGMNLLAGDEYDAIVNVESQEAPDVLRIKPGDPDHSYLYAKLLGTQEALGGEGERMPAGEAIQSPPPLPDDEIQIIHDWIAAGAPNN